MIYYNQNGRKRNAILHAWYEWINYKILFKHYLLKFTQLITIYNACQQSIFLQIWSFIRCADILSFLKLNFIRKAVRNAKPIKKVISNPPAVLPISKRSLANQL